MRGCNLILLLALLETAACNDVTPPPKAATPTYPGLIALTAVDSIPADGKTVMEVTAVVDTSVTPDLRSVKFHTTAGSFGGQADVTVAADSSRTARALLTVASEPTTALVSATTLTSTRFKSVQFTRALPERMTIVPSQLALQAGATHELTITAILRRTLGQPTAGATISFTAVDTINASRGRFTSRLVVASGSTATVNFTSGDTLYKGLIRIIGTTTGQKGLLSDTAVVQIVP